MLLSRPVDLFHPLDLTDLLDRSDSPRSYDPLDPLGLGVAIAEARRTAGARGVVDLLVTTLTRRTVRRDSDIEPYLDTLKSVCRQTRRYREAIPVFQRIAVLNPARRHEVAAELAVVHGHLGEVAKGISLLESAYRGQRRLAARRRSFEFCLIAEVAATVLRHLDLARDIAAMGRSIVLARPLVRSTDVATASTVDVEIPEGAELDPWHVEGRRPHLSLVPATAA